MILQWETFMNDGTKSKSVSLPPLDPTRAYNKSAFLMAHNAFSNKPDGWVNYQQAVDVQAQLALGVRAFEVDIWLATIDEKQDIYLLHGGWTLKWLFPQFQFKTLNDFLGNVKKWLDDNPSEVVTVFFETGDTTKNSVGVGLLRSAIDKVAERIFRPEQFSKGFGTAIGDMVRENKRLVIFGDYRGNDTHSKNSNDQFGLPLRWHYCKESVYGSDSLQSPTWTNLRDESKDSESREVCMGIVNHFPTWTTGALFTDEYQTYAQYFGSKNSLTSLANHALFFFRENKQAPNFVGVDMVNIGDGPQGIVEFCLGLLDDQKQTVMFYTLNSLPLCPDGDINNNTLLYSRKDGVPLEFEPVGPLSNCALRLANNNKELYLNYRDLTGAVKLYDAPAYYSIEFLGDGAYTVFSNQAKQYMWLDGDEPYITASGNPNNANSIWMVALDGTMPELECVSIFCDSKPFAPDNGVMTNSLVYCYDNTPLVFECIGPTNRRVFRVKGHSDLFLNFRNLTGAVKLYDSYEDAMFLVSCQSSDNRRLCQIYSSYFKAYMGLKGDEVYANVWAESYFEFRSAQPPATYQVIASANGKPMRADGDIRKDRLIYCDGNGTPLTFFMYSDNQGDIFVVSNYRLYLSYRDLTGVVKLYDTPAHFKCDDNSMYSVEAQQYMWLSDTEPYITGKGSTGDKWHLEASL